MLNTNHLKFIISFILFLSTNSILFSQVRPKPSPDKPIKQEKLYYRATAQNLNVINSNRPGFSISPYNVGAKIFQIETGFLGYT